MRAPNAEGAEGPELRTIFLGMDQMRDELLYSNVKGKNPFKDVRVREAFYKAIDIELIKTRVMRGLATPSALMIAPLLFALSKDFTRPKFDPDGAKKLLDRGRLSGRLRGHDGLPERPLRQRRGDLPGRRRHARAHRRQDRPAGAAQGEVFRQGPEARRLRDLVLSCWAGRRARSIRATCCTTSWAAATMQRIRARRSQSRRLLQQGARRTRPRRSWSRPTPPSAIS